VWIVVKEDGLAVAVPPDVKVPVAAFVTVKLEPEAVAITTLDRLYPKLGTPVVLVLETTPVIVTNSPAAKELVAVYVIVPAEAVTFVMVAVSATAVTGIATPVDAPDNAILLKVAIFYYTISYPNT